MTAQLSVSLSGTNPPCNGLFAGQITSSVTGATGPITYAWSTGATTAFVNNLPAGNYSLTVTSGGMTASSSTTLTQPAQLTLSLDADQSCEEPFTITATVGGGVMPYKYNWSLPGAGNVPTITVPSGTYCITVVDAVLCGITECITVEANPPSVEVSVNDVTCPGGTDGSLSASPSGGTPPYTYTWSNGQSGPNIVGLTAGTYTVTLTDASGCTDVASGTVTQPPAIMVSITTSGDVCAGDTDATATATATGGTPPFTYSWSTGANGPTITGLGAGTYTVTATDANNCPQTASVTIQNLPSPTVTIQGPNIICGANNSGTLTAVGAGGSPGYLYNWSTGAVTATISVSTTGTYSVTITDQNGCTASTSTTVTVIDDLVINLTSTNINCNGGNDGTATVTVTGGSMPYTYMWSTGATTPTITGLGTGTYTVTVTEGNGCKAIGNVTITQPSMISKSVEVTDVTCFGGSDGAIDVTVSGGTMPYSYNWSTGATTQDLSGLMAGLYSITVTDANGCNMSILNIVVEQSPQINLTISGTNVDCNGASTGAVDLGVSGGTPPFSYNWNNGASTQDLTGVPAGTYSVTVTDAFECDASISITITQPTPLVVTGTVTNLDCFGDEDGGIDLSVIGGTAPYTYLYSDGSTGQDLSGLAAGTYTVTVTDANGCTDQASFTITQPTELVATGTTVNVNCFGDETGSIDLSVSGGTAPYTYLYSDGSTGQDLSGLAAGTYTVTVTDANGCTDQASFTITQPTELVATGTTVNVNCFGDETGSIDLSVSGGTAPYTYLYSDGSTGQDLSGLAAGTYSVTVTDANGCTDQASFTITQPTELVATGTTVNVNCFGDETGSIDLSVSGGTAPYTYLYSDGSTGQDLSGLAAGTYTVTVTDANGCTDQASFTITQPTELVATGTTVNVNCFGDETGSIDLSVSGGTAPYTYLYSDGSTGQDLAGLAAGTYTVTVTDANGCTDQASFTITQPTELVATGTTVNVNCFGDETGSIDLSVSGGTAPYTYLYSDGSTGQDLSGLAAGTYSVTVTDANGCTDQASFTITQPTELVATGTTVNVNCFGDETGSIDLSVSGGTAPYTYLYSDGSTGQDLSGLAAGTYSVTVTDANGCTDQASFTITQPTELVATGTTVNVNCFGDETGSIDLSVSGGTAPYTYLYSDGSTGQDLSGLAAGTYSVTVTDANGCTDQASFTITQPTELVATGTTVNVNCFGDETGSIDLSVSGGTAPYTYLYSDGSTGQDLSGLGAGTYTVTVTDANGCTDQASFTITQPTELVATGTTVNVNCFGDETGSIDLSVSGGTAPYTYLYSDGSTGQDLSGLAAGTYTVTVTDANGCTDQASFTITQPTELVATGTTVNVNCFGDETGSNRPERQRWNGSLHLPLQRR